MLLLLCPLVGMGLLSPQSLGVLTSGFLLPNFGETVQLLIKLMICSNRPYFDDGWGLLNFQETHHYGKNLPELKIQPSSPGFSGLWVRHRTDQV